MLRVTSSVSRNLGMLTSVASRSAGSRKVRPCTRRDSRSWPVRYCRGPSVNNVSISIKEILDQWVYSALKILEYLKLSKLWLEIME